LKSKEAKINEMMEIVNHTISQKQKYLEDYESQLQKKEDEISHKNKSSTDWERKSIEIEIQMSEKESELQQFNQRFQELETR